MYSAIVFLLCVYALWPLYVFTMAMLRAHEAGQVSTVAWILSAPILVTALTLDIVLNYTIFAVLTWDFPKWKEFTFSQRLNRLVKCDNWRRPVALWVAVQLLDPYDHDPKGHIKK